MGALGELHDPVDMAGDAEVRCRPPPNGDPARRLRSQPRAPARHSTCGRRWRRPGAGSRAGAEPRAKVLATADRTVAPGLRRRRRRRRERPHPVRGHLLSPLRQVGRRPGRAPQEAGAKRLSRGGRRGSAPAPGVRSAASAMAAARARWRRHLHRHRHDGRGLPLAPGQCWLRPGRRRSRRGRTRCRCGLAVVTKSDRKLLLLLARIETSWSAGHVDELDPLSFLGRRAVRRRPGTDRWRSRLRRRRRRGPRICWSTLKNVIVHSRSRSTGDLEGSSPVAGRGRRFPSGFRRRRPGSAGRWSVRRGTWSSSQLSCRPSRRTRFLEDQGIRRPGLKLSLRLRSPRLDHVVAGAGPDASDGIPAGDLRGRHNDDVVVGAGPADRALHVRQLGPGRG